MKIIITSLFITALFLVVSCNKEPQPINYGSDSCDFCRMTISDKKFGCEFITGKGKVYKFDSIECLIQYIQSNHFIQDQSAKILVSNYLGSDRFIEARSASYLQSDNLQIPMGRGLAAFEKKEEMEKVKQQVSGQYYTWDELITAIK
jgi:copper chaperone NosL